MVRLTKHPIGDFPGASCFVVVEKEMKMKTINQFAIRAVVVTILLGLGACSGMSSRDKNTAIGAGVGGVAGSVLTGGSTAGTVGGAVVGGVIGNQVGKDK